MKGGPLTIWHANKEGDKIAFKSDKGEGWLRITEDHKVDAAGVKGGPQTWFKGKLLKKKSVYVLTQKQGEKNDHKLQKIKNKK
ncbi:hypothetical protein RFI_11155 [Reticulomyxa filosa]|uniref:Uncharacterized protein n=1 Tax=Reticulomyxa filosa TaxID=46433 RepID=X6NKT6_RETFI|nr:hypothetical protein RFI_11155 [Reticulomyxa filosa]|eukprot:ETO25982.1 hypothetical protein RFI_11155 [Reticulomyxa filosa]